VYLKAFAAAWCALALTSCASSADGYAAQDAGPIPTPRVPVLAACPARGTSSSLPEVTLRCLQQGPEVHSTKLGGRPVLLNLWASWCDPCKQEMPSLQAAYNRYSSQLSFLGVDTKDSTASANDFLAAISVHYPQVVDSDGNLLHRVGGAGLPVTLVLNAAGKTVYSHRGELRTKDLQAALAAAGVTNPETS
jgi:cytochrome c biogenesis protein CcmG/thiol:disulfide interchange protein DsbE